MQASAWAQDKDTAVIRPDNQRDFDEIIIKRSGDLPNKVTLEIAKDGQVTVNGKPADQYHDGNLTIIRRKDQDDLDMPTIDGPSPFLVGPDDIRIKAWQDQAQANALKDQLMLAQKMERSFRFDRAMLGVGSRNASPTGAQVQEVTKGSPAEKIGLQKDDIIIRIDDTKIENPKDLAEAIQNHKPEDKVVVTYLRAGKELKATAVLSNAGGKESFSYDMRPPVVRRDFNEPYFYRFKYMDQGPKIGIRAQDTEDGKGAKVLDVDDQSNAQKAGIKAGDVITQFDGKQVTNASSLADLAHDAKAKSSVQLKITRGGKPMDIEVKIPHELKTADL